MEKNINHQANFNKIDDNPQVRNFLKFTNLQTFSNLIYAVPDEAVEELTKAKSLYRKILFCNK